MDLDAKQQEAVDLCLSRRNRIVAVTGAAGTGKTTIIKTVADALLKEQYRVVIAAPTGKAARRITQATGHRAVTMHRMLEYPRPGERDEKTGKPINPGIPKRGRKNPLDYDAIIVDEYAMVNYELDRNVIDALGRGARLLVFGDISQLPPIEPYQVKTTDTTAFERHLARCSIALEHVYRQAGDSGILDAAGRVRKGTLPKRTEDFNYLFSEKPIDVLKTLVSGTDAAYSHDFRLLGNQIIVPQRKGWVGTAALNRLLRDILNPNAGAYDELELPRTKHNDDPDNPMYVCVGDKVVCTENTYDMRDYQRRYGEYNDKGQGIESTFINTPESSCMLNGETGIITRISDDGSIHIDMGDRTVDVPSTYVEHSWKKDTYYDIDPRKHIDLAYALTTHKCQGSEFDHVIYVINRSSLFMLNRKNTYTAITRAKKTVRVITDQRGLQLALRPEIKAK